MKYTEREQIEIATRCIAAEKFEYANNIIMKLLTQSELDAELYAHIGMLYLSMKQFSLAATYLRESFDMEKSFETLEMLAHANFLAKKYDFAAIQYEELIKHIPSDDFYERCIDSYEKLDYYGEAIRVAQMYNYAKDSVDSLAKLVFMYITAGMIDEAINSAEEMQKKYPNHVMTYNTYGFLYECIYNDYPKAKEYFKKAGKLGFINAYYNLGVCCKQSEDFENAEKYLKKLANMKVEGKIDYNYTLGSIYLANRKLRLGYKYYSKRNASKEIAKRSLASTWDGKPYPTKTLYISSEQGFGDNIQFIRYIPMTFKYFKRVVYAAPDNLVRLFQNSFPKENYPNFDIVSHNDIVRYNKFALIMDLPCILHQTYHNIPAQKSYLSPTKREKDMMKTNYFDNNELKIGLCWKAKGMGLRDAVYRTIDAPYYFKRLFDFPDIKFYSFQMGDIFGMLEKYPQIVDLSHEFKDFCATAAALANLDILITVDTALAHLAGALGVKTYLLLCHAPDWRWFDNDHTTEWYPSFTIIKQHDRRTWQDVSDKLVEYIEKDVKSFAKRKKK